MVKLLAFNLPQYHIIPENNRWWGEGFTDWVNVKKAQPLFKGHNQPRVPLDGYYDMTEKSTHIRQAQLAKRYGIYGFCYYHYWFNGKMLLEKPLEMILSEPEVDLPFCMCWANEPWTRSWNGKNRQVIMPQSYGYKEDWIKHIDYLMPFFKDNRYIKVDNKPLFVIYRTSNIDNCDDIIALWDKKCRENGFDGIYIAEERNDFQSECHCKNSKAIIDFEPGCTNKLQRTFFSRAVKKIKNIFGTKFTVFSYESQCQDIVNRTNYVEGEKQHFLGMFTGWDNTPRKKQGNISQGSTPKAFGEYLSKQIKRSHEINSEFLFINAWNEWAEGAYLEPDELNGYGYLEAVQKALRENSD
jgi:lipopolysaccharide biosynthesis protein